MKKMTNFWLKLLAFVSLLLIGAFNACQFAGLGQPIPREPGKPGTESGGPRFGPPIPSTDGKPSTESGGPRFIQPREDIDDDRPPTQPRRPIRGGCASISQQGLTALVPKNKLGRTVSEYPTFFFYLPQTEAELATFTLEDESGNQIYKQDVTIRNLSGVIGVNIPANQNVPPLEVGKSYRWNLTVICDSQDRSSDQIESGTVRRVEISADIRRQLDQADPRQKTVIYAENGIWQDALSTLAAARQANPNDAELAADWESLLDSVTLSKIAKEPIVQTQPQP